MYRAHEARAALADSGARVDILCSPDLPDEQYERGADSVLKRGEAEFTRDVMQQAHARLKVGGYLAVSVDNPSDNWMHDQMRTILDKVTVHQHADGRAYWDVKQLR